MIFEITTKNDMFNHIVVDKVFYCPNTIGNNKAVVKKGQTIFWVFDMKIHEIVVDFISNGGYVNSELTIPYPPHLNNCFLTYEEAYEFYKYVSSFITK